MPPDIDQFVDNLLSAANVGAYVEPPIGEDVLNKEHDKYVNRFQIRLPSMYLELCRKCDGFITPHFARLHGLETKGKDLAYPAKEGLLDVHERQLEEEFTRPSFVEFGNRDGTEFWGFDTNEQCFVRAGSDPASTRVRTKFMDFEEMFRDLFRIGDGDHS
jgi:hypothetical protein